MTFQQLIEELIEGGHGSFTVRSYSGRGMYGEECLAVVSEDPLGALAMISHEAGLEGISIPASVRQDQLGKEFVVYWPGVAYEGKEEL